MDRETLTRAGKVGSTRCLLMVGANLLANNPQGHRETTPAAAQLGFVRRVGLAGGRVSPRRH